MASLARTILEDHLERGELVPGQEIALRVDQALAQDATGTMAMMQFELFGEERVRVETAVVYVDHNILQIDFNKRAARPFRQAMAAKYGAWFSRPGNGICHYVHCERFAKPGQTLIGADSHTTQSGSCAMIAIGAGGLDVAVCMAGHPFELPCPKIVGVFLENELARPWVQAEDVILELLRRRGVRGGRGALFEITGPGVATLSYSERGTVANMIAELGSVGAMLRRNRISQRLISATATPGSRQILDQITQSGTYGDLLMAGVRMLEPACGPCVGMGQAPPSGSNSLRTFNRNFPGRSGTADDQVYLCSPAVAAASMLTGVISDPRELSAVELAARPEARPEVVQQHILDPAPAEAGAQLE